jgi:hypothetical protein
MTKRLATSLTAALILLLPSLPASAAGDDPEPQSWPTIENPGTTAGSSDDPKTVDWPEITKPDTGTTNDPQPKDWPTPEQL